jgi:hypothetical protein
MDKETQDFCWRYDAHVGPSARISSRHRLVTMSDWNKDASEPAPIWDVPMVEIHMPEDRFRALMEHDHWLEYNQRAHEGFQGRDALRIARERERECRIRHEHPGVQAAWEQYQIMLSMVDTAS